MARVPNTLGLVFSQGINSLLIALKLFIPILTFSVSDWFCCSPRFSLNCRLNPQRLRNATEKEAEGNSCTPFSLKPCFMLATHSNTGLANHFFVVQEIASLPRLSRVTPHKGAGTRDKPRK